MGQPPSSLIARGFRSRAPHSAAIKCFVLWRVAAAMSGIIRRRRRRCRHCRSRRGGYRNFYAVLLSLVDELGRLQHHAFHAFELSLSAPIILRDEIFLGKRDDFSDYTDAFKMMRIFADAMTPAHNEASLGPDFFHTHGNFFTPPRRSYLMKASI